MCENGWLFRSVDVPYTDPSRWPGLCVERVKYQEVIKLVSFLHPTRRQDLNQPFVIEKGPAKMACLKSTLSIFLGALAIAALQASANVVTFVTPIGATTSGGPVNASATFITGSGTVTITLSDLLANPTDVAQLISDLDFTLSGGQTTGFLSASSGQQINVLGNGTFLLGATGSTGWGLNNNVGGGLQLDALGFIGPAGLIIGPPGAGGVYTAANGSIAGNGPHNPFLNETATFVVDVAGVTVDSTITSATFSFGTVPGINVPGRPPGQQTPEPASIALVGIGLLAFGAIRRKRKA